MESTRNLSCPAIHLNGSGFNNLQEQYRQAYTAIVEATEALQRTAPHPRDFYVLPNSDEKFANACQEHAARLTKLRIVQEELVHLINELYEQKLNFGK